MKKEINSTSMHGRRLKFNKSLLFFALAVIGIIAFIAVGTSTNSFEAGSGASLASMALIFGARQLDSGTGGTGGNPEETPEMKSLRLKVQEATSEAIKKGLSERDEKIKSLEEKLEALKGAKPEKYDEMKSEVERMASELKAMKESGTQDKKENIFNQVYKFLSGEAVKKRLKEKAAGFEKMEIKAAALMTVTDNVVTATGYSLNVNNYVDAEIGRTPKDKNFILSLITVETQNGSEKIWWAERTNEEGDAAFIGEGDLKPLVSAKWETKSADIKEVAERWKQSNRMIMHTQRLTEDFREHANELIESKIDDQVLTGDGIGDNLKGIATYASAFVAPAALANFYVDPNIYDVINAIKTQIALANFDATEVLLNTVEGAKMLGLKDAEGRYLVPPFVTPDGKIINGLAVTLSNKVPDGKICVGDLKKFKAVFAEDVIYEQGYENDDFSKNLTSNKLEAFLGTYIKAPHVAAIVYDDIATVKTAIGSI